MLRPSLHLTLVASVSVAGLTLPAPAYALTSGFVPTTARSLAPNAEADALYEEGRKDFSQGLYKSAIEKFEVAYKRSKDPLILYNIGQSYKKLYEDDAQLEYLQGLYNRINRLADTDACPHCGRAPMVGDDAARGAFRPGELSATPSFN